jgi:hypothetical protein
MYPTLDARLLGSNEDPPVIPDLAHLHFRSARDAGDDLCIAARGLRTIPEVYGPKRRS